MWFRGSEGVSNCRCKAFGSAFGSGRKHDACRRATNGCGGGGSVVRACSIQTKWTLDVTPPRTGANRCSAGRHSASDKKPADAYVALHVGTMSRPTSQTSNATTSTRLGHTRNLSAKTNTIVAPTTAKPLPNPLPASDIRLFVTNLRLLDFDLRDDWPNITTQTFSAKNADQKQRISGTEWALFRLFEIWDPSETAQVRWHIP